MYQYNLTNSFTNQYVGYFDSIKKLEQEDYIEFLDKKYIVEEISEVNTMFGGIRYATVREIRRYIN